jgi:histidinol-phosphate aminotransferase
MSGNPRPRVRDDLKAMEGYHSPQVTVSVRLNTNESPFAPPQAFVDAWCAEVADWPFNRYPDRSARELRGSLASFLSQSAQRLFCANGSNEVLQTILLTFGGPGRRALVFEPSYVLHAHIAAITGTGVITAERTPTFEIDRQRAVEVIEQESPDVIFITSPNNPTGLVEERATVEALLEAALARTPAPALLVVDEAYAEFSPWTALELVDDDLPLVVSRTYSKVWSMAALRLGFCVGPDWIVEELDKVVLPYHLSVATQTAGTLVLQWGAEMAARVATIVSERERLSKAMADLGVEFTPSGANFILFKPEVPGVDEPGRAVWQALLDRDVLVRDFSRWPRLEGHLRVTVGTPPENDAFLAALKEVLA